MHFLTPRRILALLIALLLISSFLPASQATHLASPLSGLAEMFATPIRAPLHRLGVAMRANPPRELKFAEPTNPGYNIQRIGQLEIELRNLRQENQQLRRVRQIIGDDTPLVLVYARVTGVTGPPDEPILRIDRGSRDHIAAGDVVVTGYHLVGEVTSANTLTAQVRPIAAKNTRLLVRLMPNEADAQLRPGSGIWLEWNTQQQAFVQDKVAINTQAKVGDFALLADEGWLPKAQGCFVGQVTVVRDDPMDPYSFKQLVVQPTFQLTHLRRVTVLVDE